MKDMHPHVVTVTDPDFLFIGRQTYAMARISVTTDRALVPTKHFDTGKFLSVLQIAHLKSQQFVHSHKYTGFVAVDGEGTDPCTERPDFQRD